MLITQPPVKELLVRYYDNRNNWRTEHYHKIQSKPGSPGITFDDIRFHGRFEENADYFASRRFEVVGPAAGRVVVCTAQDVMVELAKNDGAGGNK